MISVTLTVNKLTALSYLSNPKVLEDFDVKVISEFEASIEGKTYFLTKKVNFQDVEYNFTRRKLLSLKT